VRFIDEHRDRFGGVEPICRVLTGHGCGIDPSTNYAFRTRPPSARATRDAQLTVLIRRIDAENYAVYGVRKVWWELQRQGHRVARCSVERLMRAEGLSCAVRGRKIRTTVPPLGPHHDRRPSPCLISWTLRRRG
jgi:putative transposase